MNFLDDYKLVTTGNECPEIFHQWAGLTCLGSVLGRRVWLDQEIFKVYPNLYVMLVGDAGIKKSTAMNFAIALTSEFKQYFPITTDNFTKQELSKFMGAEDSPCLRRFEVQGEEKPRVYTHLNIYCDEFINFLSAGNEQQMANFLVQAWASDSVGTRTKGAGSDLVEQPFINMLACMTTDTSLDLVKQKIISSGFTRRCAYAYAPRGGKPVPRPKITPEQEAAWQRCLQRLDEVRKLIGPFSWDPIVGLWDPWYNENYEKKEKQDLQVMKNWLNSKPEYVLSVAMLCAVAESDELVIQPRHFEQALEFVEPLDKNVLMLFSAAGENELAQVTNLIEQFVCNNPKPVPAKRIVGTFYKDVKNGTEDVYKCLEFLENQGKVKTVEKTVGSGLQQRQLKFYVKAESTTED